MPIFNMRFDDELQEKFEVIRKRLWCNTDGIPGNKSGFARYLIEKGLESIDKMLFYEPIYSDIRIITNRLENNCRLNLEELKFLIGYLLRQFNHIYHLEHQTNIGISYEFLCLLLGYFKDAFKSFSDQIKYPEHFIKKLYTHDKSLSLLENITTEMEQIKATEKNKKRIQHFDRLQAMFDLYDCQENTQYIYLNEAITTEFRIALVHFIRYCEGSFNDNKYCGVPFPKSMINDAKLQYKVIRYKYSDGTIVFTLSEKNISGYVEHKRSSFTVNGYYSYLNLKLALHGYTSKDFHRFLPNTLGIGTCQLEMDKNIEKSMLECLECCETEYPEHFVFYKKLYGEV